MGWNLDLMIIRGMADVAITIEIIATDYNYDTNNCSINNEPSIALHDCRGWHMTLAVLHNCDDYHKNYFNLCLMESAI